MMFALAVIFGSSPASAQLSAAEHASHHPGGGADAPPAMPASGKAMSTPSPAGTAPANPMAGMMKQMMGQMMPPSSGTNMGSSAGMCCGSMGAKPFYPSMMEWPALTDEARRAIRAEALNRLGSGAKVLTTEQYRLRHALMSNDFGMAQDAIKAAREGLALTDSGASALRGLDEGRPPRQIALRWFKDQTGIEGSDQISSDDGLAGLSWWHLIAMTLLIAALVAALLLRSARLRRITRLVERLTPPSMPLVAAAPGSVIPPSAPAATPLPGGVPTAVQRPWKGILRIKAIFDETPNVKTFRLMEANQGSIPFTFLPGQYATVTSEIEGQKVRRSYTISSSPTQRDYVELTIKREQYGLESRHLHDHADIGDLLEVSAPAGRFFFTGKEAEGIVLIAGGVGITPMMSVLRSLTDRSYEHDIYLLYGVNTPADLIFKEECDYLARRHTRLHVAYIVSKADGTDWAGPVGYMTADFITASVPNITRRRVHLCGPPPMMEAVKAALGQLQLPPDQIKTEEFAPPTGGPVADTEPTIPAAEDIPASPPVQSAPTFPSAHATVAFSKSGKTGSITPDQSVLEAAEAIGVVIDYECRAGTCGRCKIPMRQGQVTMEVEDALAADEKAGGIILACQAKSAGDLVVDA
ncbi:FAD-binding oxidoreductase [Sphingomonas sp. SRS2]|uniref:FAD-binding oxidoreductase n=1 Tax=Sphingomonas sp. SRS2 TaxID=133190 RepID=UPI001F45826D|nr:FAD-binding oxidoreductase [Sphingomonas sp. SRS2]